MLRTRIIPCLLLAEDRLVKTVRFGREAYIGDPVNTARIFNELEADELMILDIRATPESRAPNMELLSQLATECFMPLAYGGGIRDFETAKNIFSAGVEKVVVNTAAYRRPSLVTEIAAHFGSQAVIGSVDVKRSLLGKPTHYVAAGREKTAKDPLAWARELETLGAGELLLTSIDREGTWSGYDVELAWKFSDALSIPVIAAGGAGSIAHIGTVVKNGGVSAVAVGSMVVYQGKGMGVLVNFPDRKKLQAVLA